MLERNLEALARRDPELAQRLCLPVATHHVARQPGGEVHYTYRHAARRLDLTGDQVEQLVGQVEQGDTALVVGVGLGELVAPLLARGARVVAWERDPCLLRLALSAHDWSAAIADGALRPALVGGLLGLPREEALGSWTIVRHPLLGGIYAGELELLERGLGERRALLCEGALFVDDVREALAALGHSVFCLDVELVAEEETEHLVRSLAPQIVVTVNYRTGLAELCERLGVALVSWEIDPTVDRIEPCRVRPCRAHVFTYRRAQQQAFREAGFEHVAHLPLATNPGRRHPVQLSEDEARRYGADVAFAGASMVEQAGRFRQQILEALAVLGVQDGEPRLEHILTRQRQDFSRFVLRELVQQHLGVLAEEMARRGSGDDLLMLVAEIAAAEKRLTYVANLGRFGVQVWGDGGWRAVEQHGAVYMGPAGHQRELNRVYVGARINVDIGRLYQADIVTMRVFDVLACGGFVLAEHSDDLARLLEPGVEVDSYRNLDELGAKIEHYLAHPDAAAAIAARGRERVRRDHTIAARVQQMLASVRADT